MSIVHSCEESQSASRVSGGSPPSGSSRQAASSPRRRARRASAGHRAGRRLDPLRLEQLGDELAEDDRLAVGDEVGLARAPVRAPSSRPSTTLSTCVVSVRCRAAADPGELARLDRGDDLGQQRRVAGAPDEPRAHDDGLEAVVARRPEPRARRAPWSTQYSAFESGRSGAVSSTSRSGSPASSAASVPQWTKRATPASRQAASAFSVPVTLPRDELLARAPLARGARRGGRRSRSPRRRPRSRPRRRGRRGPARRRGPRAAREDAGARQRAHPAAARDQSRRPARRPMKPEPPVTNALSAPVPSAHRRARASFRRRGLAGTI